MENKDPRKYRGPETWALVRDAYLAGEPAKLVCARFDVSYANLRAKALREGWTRRAFAKAVDRTGVRRAASGAAAFEIELDSGPPLTPPGLPPADALAPITAEGAVQAAMALASQALADGRAADANAILKATEAFSRLSGRGAGAPPAAAPPDQDEASDPPPERTLTPEEQELAILAQHEFMLI